MMKYFLISLILGNSLALTACSSHTTKDPDSYLYSVPVGSKLILNKEITIPANLARRYFQNGKAVMKKDINIYYPHCSLLMETLVDFERTIQPAEFEIYKVSDDQDYVQRPVYLVANILTNIDGPTIIAYASYYFLQSSENPDVRSLECVQWNDPVNVEYLSINQVKKALGEYFSLKIIDQELHRLQPASNIEPHNYPHL